MADGPDHLSSLVSAARSGDRNALSELITRVEGSLANWLSTQIDSQFRSVVSPDDVLQETYADAFMSIQQLEDSDFQAFQKWIKAVARNNLLDGMKSLRAAKRGGGNRQFRLTSADESSLALLDQLQDSGRSPSGCYSAKEAGEMVQNALHMMPERYRTIIKLYDLEGRSVEDVCSRCSCSPGALYMRRGRALRLMSEFLGESPLT